MKQKQETTMSVPFFDAGIPAGFPSPAADYEEESINLLEKLVPRPLSTFFVTTVGDSMQEAFIPEKSILVVDRKLKPKNNSIVVATYNGEFTVKYYAVKEGKCYLVPANKKYKPIEITEEMQMEVWGVVTYIIINPKDVKNVCPC